RTPAQPAGTGGGEDIGRLRCGVPPLRFCSRRIGGMPLRPGRAHRKYSDRKGFGGVATAWSRVAGFEAAGYVAACFRRSWCEVYEFFRSGLKHDAKYATDVTSHEYKALSS